ncbi:MAG: beta-lactamase family protein [Desulfobacterales bacterium]|nr:beta-lactamase family protein [Pseudomonadota bacterium]MBU4355292.1 beta-lactamase family protein [Pseudomonadota bacterium]MCG2770996.1 beta-lactamase family protein [Desulfobacterales bacterium]
MPDRWVPLQKLLEAGVSQGVFTAAVALAGLKGELRWEGAAGFLSSDPGAAAATADTVFDLASLTKPLATTLALMVLAGRGQLDLATPLGEVLPAAWLPPDKRPLTLRYLLTHRSGLPAWRPFYAQVLAAPASARPGLLARLAAATPLEYPPDTATLYSDLGFMLLAAVVESLSGQNLDRFCREAIYRPLGLKTLGFIPLPQPAQTVPTTENRKPKTENRMYAFTEPGLIAGRPPAGEVHDENAWAAGGVAGHAGLFGPGREVFHLVASLWQAYSGEKTGPLTPAAVQLFLTVPPGADRACGFDIPGADPATRAAGRYFSPRSVGHLGFTGTSFWLDLDSGQMVVLLTNRVHLGRDDKTKIAAFRPRFHEAASRALGFNQPH